MVKTRQDKRQRRKLHIRRLVNGSETKPRVYVFRSNKYMTVSAANDDTGKVLASLKSGKTVDDCKKLGEDFGKKLKELKVEVACFDRSGYKFHSRLSTLVDGIRSVGIKI
jgi:large subunit ribosomal protein L18